MDDLGSKLDALLNSPDGMAKIQNAMASFGLSGQTQPATQSEQTQSEQTQSAAQSAAQSEQTQSAAQSVIGGLPDAGMLMKLLPLLGGMDKEDDQTALLRALKPYLHGEREKRLEDSIQLMKLQRLLPLLHNQDFFK